MSEGDVREALEALVAAVKEGLHGPAKQLEGLADGLERLGAVMGPVDARVAQQARGTAHSIRQHASDLRAAFDAYEAKTLPGEEVPALALVEGSAA